MLWTPNQACFYTRAWIDLRNPPFCFKNPSLCFMETRVAMFQKPIFCLQEDNLHGDISWFQEPIFVFHGGKSCLQGDNSVLCGCYVPETHLLSPRRQSPWRHLLVPGRQLLAPRNLDPWRQLLVLWRQLLVQREHFFTLREQMFCQKKILNDHLLAQSGLSKK